MKKQNSLQATDTFDNFNGHVKTTLVEKLNDTNIDKSLLIYRLNKAEEIYTQRLKIVCM